MRHKFFLGLVDDPKRIKILLEIITEVTIDFLNLLYSKIEVEDGIRLTLRSLCLFTNQE